VTVTEHTELRPSLAATLASAGVAAIVLVAVGGLSLGLAGWYAAMVWTPALAGFGDALLVLALPAGIVVAFAGWLRYSDYFAWRASTDRRTALRYDAWSWFALAACGAGILLPIRGGGVGRSVAIGGLLWLAVKVVVAARFNRTVRDVLVTFVVTRVPIIFIAELASIIIGQRPGHHVVTSTNPLLAVWGRWDAVHYLDIAARGYYGTDMAFFPLYPALIHVLGTLVSSDLIAGLLISNIAFFFGLLFFYKLVEHALDRSDAVRAIFYVSIFPTAVFFSAVYTESLFFALTVASFYYIRERHWIVAGLLGGLAALTRVEGVLLVIPFAMEAAGALRSGSLTKLPQIVIGTILIPAGLAVYMAVLWVLRGDPLYFSHVQVHWNRHLAAPWASVSRSIHEILYLHTAQTRVDQAIELTFTILMIGVLIGGFRSLRPSFWVYMLLSIVIPMSTSSLMSMPRFALVLFPMFMVLAQWGRKPWVNNLIVAFSLPLLGLFTVLFADWYWVA
jgi:hypothetical protein